MLNVNVSAYFPKPLYVQYKENVVLLKHIKPPCDSQWLHMLWIPNINFHD